MKAAILLSCLALAACGGSGRVADPAPVTVAPSSIVFVNSPASSAAIVGYGLLFPDGSQISKGVLSPPLDPGDARPVFFKVGAGKYTVLAQFDGAGWTAFFATVEAGKDEMAVFTGP